MYKKKAGKDFPRKVTESSIFGQLHMNSFISVIYATKNFTKKWFGEASSGTQR